ncbi:MAG: hypothetical protein ABI693_07680 [Bryobacteraceae bacterium]
MRTRRTRLELGLYLFDSLCIRADVGLSAKVVLVDPDKQWRIDTGWYLKGATLRKQRWTARSDDWDHDHCSCCWAKFAEWHSPEILDEGYTTTDRHEHGAGYHWVCATCFIDLKIDMQWQLEPCGEGTR